MAIVEAKARLEHRPSVCFAVPVCILEEKQIWSSPDIGAAVAQQQAARKTQPVRPHRHLVGFAVRIGVFQNLDAIPRLLAGWSALWIFVKLKDPQAAAGVPGHRHWINDFGFAGKEARLETRRQLDQLLGFVRGQRAGGGRRMRARKLAPGRSVFVDGKSKILIKVRVILASTGERARPQPQAAGHHRKKENRSCHDSDGALIKEKIVERVNGIPEAPRITGARIARQDPDRDVGGADRRYSQRFRELARVQTALRGGPRS